VAGAAFVVTVAMMDAPRNQPSGRPSFLSTTLPPLVRWSADILTAFLVGGYAIGYWWPAALELTQTFGPRESGDIKILGVLVFLLLGLVGTVIILGLSLVVVLVVVRLLPKPLQVAVRVAGASTFLLLLYIYRHHAMFLLRNLIRGTLRGQGIAV
jgi:hypothetical protein